MGVFISLHYFATGPGQELFQYLAENGKEAALLEIPFEFSRRDSVKLSVYQKGEFWQEEFPAPKGPRIYRHFRELSLTSKALKLLRKRGFSCDVYVGNGAFDTLSGLFEKIPKTVLFTIDYAPQAQPSYLRPLYRAIDAYVCKRVSRIWNLSERMQQARVEAEPGLKKKCAPALTVPHGTHYEKLKNVRRLPKNKFSLAFMGHLKADSGVDLILQAFPELINAFPELSLTIVGTGPEEEKLKKLSFDLGLMEHVTFTGFMESHEELEKILCSCAVGIALYDNSKDVFTRNADPGKPKVYLGCGLPVLITDVPLVAREIQDRGAGLIVESSCSSLLKGIKMISDNYEAFRQRAEEMGSDYDWSRVFKKALVDLYGQD